MAEDAKIAEARNTWEAAAPGWAKWEQTLSQGLEPATDMLLDMAGVAAGARVLDIASGAGYQTLQAARRVGSTGAVVASDISPIMLEYVGRNAMNAGISNITTLASAAENLPAEAVAYDAAICRLGLMLFPGPLEAASAIRSVLKPGGRFAALVFTTPTSNPLMAQPMSILLRHAGKQPPSAGGPGLFALGGEGALEQLFSNAGYSNVETRIVRAPLKLATASDALAMIQQAFGAYRAVVANLGEDERAAAWADVLTALSRFEGAEGFRAELEFIIGAGQAAQGAPIE